MAYFDANDVRFSDDGKTLERCPESFMGCYSVPFGVEEIGENAFKNCSGLEALVLPRTIKALKAGAFEGVKSLSKLCYEGTLDEWFNVTTLCLFNSSHTLFVDGHQLIDVVIPATRTIIPKRAFYNVHGIRTVTFHDEITDIENSAFNKSSISGRIVLPPKLKRIGAFAFLGCRQATGFCIPSSVESIGDGAFRFCSHVKRYEVIDNPYYRHYGLDLVTGDSKTLLAVAQASLSGRYRVGESIENIPDFVFGSLPEKVIEIELPYGIRRIGKKAFEGYNGKIVIQDSKKSLLDNIGIPESRILLSHDFEPDFKASSIIEFISQNPYRILGLGSGASAKEVISRYHSFLTLAEDKTSLKYPTDTIPGLDNIIRTKKSIRDAMVVLQNDIDRFIYSLFWFKSDTPNQKQMIELLCDGRDSESVLDEYDGDLSFDPFMALYYFMCGDFCLGVDQYLELVDADSEQFKDVVDELIGATSEPLVQEDVNHRIMSTLVDIFGSETLKRYIEQTQKYKASWYIKMMTKQKQAEEYSDIRTAIAEARRAAKDVDALKDTAYHIFDQVSNREDSLPVDLLYECGVQMIANFEEAIMVSSDRKLRLKLVHDMAYCHKYLFPKDRDVKALTAAISKVKKPLDIIPPFELIEEDCMIYEAMISWLMCDNFTKLVQEFYPVVAPLSQVYQAGFKNIIDSSSYQIVSPRDYMYDEFELVADMVSNNVIRILNDKVKKKGKIFSSAEIKELQLAYSLLNDCKTTFFFRDENSKDLLKKAIGAVLLFLRQNNAKPSYCRLFTLQTDDEYWKAAQKNNTELLKYIAVYGKSGKHIAEAKALMGKNEKDDEQMWHACRTQSDYENYLKNSPICLHKTEAKEIIAKKQVTNGLCFFINIILIASAVVLFFLIVN